MPSHRAILEDITKLGLNPKQAHTQISASGRLSNKKNEPVTEEPTVVETFVEQHVPVQINELDNVVEVTKDEPYDLLGVVELSDEETVSTLPVKYALVELSESVQEVVEVADVEEVSTSSKKKSKKKL